MLRPTGRGRPDPWSDRSGFGWARAFHGPIHISSRDGTRLWKMWSDTEKKHISLALIQSWRQFVPCGLSGRALRGGVRVWTPPGRSAPVSVEARIHERHSKMNNEESVPTHPRSSLSHRERPGHPGATSHSTGVFFAGQPDAAPPRRLTREGRQTQPVNSSQTDKNVNEGVRG